MVRMGTTRRGWGCGRRATVWPGVVGLLAWLLLAPAWLGGAGAATAQSDNGVYFIYKGGYHDPGHDTMFDHLERDHGPMRQERRLYPWAIELDIYADAGPNSGLGLAIEMNRAVNTYHFADGTRVHAYTKGVNFLLKTYARWGFFWPYVAGGIGNYYMNFQQPGLSFRDSPHTVYSGRVGVRLQGNGWGILAEAVQTDALLRVNTLSGPGKAQLGGYTQYLGIFFQL